MVKRIFEQIALFSVTFHPPFPGIVPTPNPATTPLPMEKVYDLCFTAGPDQIFVLKSIVTFLVVYWLVRIVYGYLSK